MIKIYSEKNHSPESEWRNHLIHPIRAYWGDGTSDWLTWEKDFSFYKDYFSIVKSPQESDVGFLPLTLNYYVSQNKLNLVNEQADLMGENGQQLFVWIDGDHTMSYTHPNCIFIKYFSDSTEDNSNEIIQPGDMKEDLLNTYYKGKFQLREKSDIPKIGFDGIANYPNHKLVGTILKNAIQNVSYKLRNGKVKPDPVVPFLLKRNRYLKQLSQSNSIDSNIIIRDSFAPGTIGNNINARKQFVNNIINSDYTFCYRGAANYSLRFYETMCLGRIPLLINTNCVLPFEDKIDWKNCILWIEESDIQNMPELILDFHKSMTNDQFIEKQKYCREIWESFLSKEGFIKNFHDRIHQINPNEFKS